MLLIHKHILNCICSLHIVPTCGAEDHLGLEEGLKAIAQLHSDQIYYDGVVHGIVGPFSTQCSFCRC